jgi:hypothetical protein
MPDSWARYPDSNQNPPEQQANVSNQQQPLGAKPGSKRKASSALDVLPEQAGKHRRSFNSYRNPVADKGEDEVPAGEQNRNTLVR